uniref:CCHC-type domain-containing protein n=1 Tax=Strigamia maritima TaxID=126957 RepID=T1IS18_STRMM
MVSPLALPSLLPKMTHFAQVAKPKMGEKDDFKAAAAHIKPLTFENWKTWKIMIQLILDEHDLLNFTLETPVGSAIPPLATASEEIREKFNRRSRKATRSILIQSFAEQYREAAMQFTSTNEHKEDEEMHQYIGQVDQAAREVEDLAMTDEEAKTFMLISCVGPGFDSLKQIIDQWDDTQFTWKNVCAALLTEDHRRKFDAVATLTEHTEAQAFLAFKKSQKSKEKKTAINIPSSKSTDLVGTVPKQDLSEITCFRCQEKGHYSNKCQNAAVPRGNKTRGGAVRGRGSDKAEAYYCKRVKDISNVVACTTDYGIEENAKIRVPVTPGTTLFKPKEGHAVEDFPFRLLVSPLMFLALRSRPDILFSVIHLSQFNTAHNGSHIKALLQILKPMKPGRRSEIEIETRNANRLVKIDSQLPMISEQLAKDYGIEENAKIRVPVTPGTTLFKPKEGHAVEDFPFRLLVSPLMFLALRRVDFRDSEDMEWNSMRGILTINKVFKQYHAVNVIRETRQIPLTPNDAIQKSI